MQQGNLSTKLRSMSEQKYLELDDEAQRFVTFCLQVCKPVTLSAISVQALKIRDELLANADNTAK